MHHHQNPVLSCHLNSLRWSDPRARPGARKLHGSGRDDFRIRVGDYRVLYEVDDRARVVRIMRVRHRREAYR